MRSKQGGKNILKSICPVSQHISIFGASLPYKIVQNFLPPNISDKGQGKVSGEKVCP